MGKRSNLPLFNGKLFAIIKMWQSQIPNLAAKNKAKSLPYAYNGLQKIEIIKLLILFIVMFNSCSLPEKSGVFVLNDSDLNCDFDGYQLTIDSSNGNEKKLVGNVVLPVFDYPNRDVVREKEKQFLNLYKSDSLYKHKITVEGIYDNSTYDAPVYDGCSDSHILKIKKIISVTKGNKR